MSGRRLMAGPDADAGKAEAPRKKDEVRRGKAVVQRRFPDARREMAQKAAKAQWADWASKKAH